MFKYGIISGVKAGFARVKFDEDEIVSDWLPVLMRKSLSDKESWQLEVNEHVVCLMDESCEEGVILGAIASESEPADPGEGAGKFRKKFSDGTEIEYDKGSGKLTVDVKGDLSAKATGDIEISTTGKATVDAGSIECTITGSAKVTAPTISLTGNVTVTGALTAASVSAGGLAITGGGSMTGSGSMSLQGGLTVTGDVVAGGKSLSTHTHTVPSGGGTSGPPI